MIHSRPADTYPGGSSGAERHTKITPGEEVWSTTQPGGYYCAALRAKRCHCIFTSRISTMQFFATLKLLLSNQIKKKNNARFFEPEVQLSDVSV